MDPKERQRRAAAMRERFETTRAAMLLPSSWEDATHSIEVEFAAGARVLKYDWRTDKPYFEELPVDRLDLTEINAGAHVLRSHGREGDGAYGTPPLDCVLGASMPGTARTETRTDGQLVAVARIQLSQEPEDRPVVNKIRTGIIRKWSFGYERIGQPEITRDEATGYEVRTWPRYRAYEISPVAIPADGGTGTRSLDEWTEGEMDPKDQGRGQGTQGKPETPAGGDAAQREADIRAAREAGAQAERQRQSEIRGAAQKLGLPEDACRVHLDDVNVSVDAAIRALVDERAKRDQAEAPITGVHGARVNGVAGGDQRDKTRAAAEDVILFRMAPQLFPDVAARLQGNPLHGRSMLEVGERMAHDRRIYDGLASPVDRAKANFGIDVRSGSHTTSDFPLALAAGANKVLRASYDRSDRTFLPLVTRRDLPDFKSVNVVSIGEIDALEEIKEHGEYQFVTFGERKEAWALGKYGGRVGFSWEAQVNDDLGAFSRLAIMLGTALSDRENRLVWVLWTAPQTMAYDSKAVWHNDHANLVAAAAIAAGQLNSLRGKLRAQTGINVARKLRLRPRFLVVPSGQVDTVEQMMSPNYVPTSKGDAVTNWMRSLEIIDEPLLDDASGDPYFMAVDPALFPWLEHGYLIGEGGVVTEQRQGFEVDGLEVKARLVVGARIVDHRGAAKSSLT